MDLFTIRIQFFVVYWWYLCFGTFLQSRFRVVFLFSALKSFCKDKNPPTQHWPWLGNCKNVPSLNTSKVKKTKCGCLLNVTVHWLCSYLTHELNRICHICQQSVDFLSVGVVLQLCASRWLSTAVDSHPHIPCRKVCSKEQHARVIHIQCYYRCRLSSCLIVLFTRRTDAQHQLVPPSGLHSHVLVLVAELHLAVAVCRLVFQENEHLRGALPSRREQASLRKSVFLLLSEATNGLTRGVCLSPRRELSRERP